MGMYDELRCEYPLPGTPPEGAQDWVFQTKDLDCFMESFTLTKDGRLVHDKGEEDFSGLTGAINFYGSNVVARGPGVYTKNGEDALWVEYRAVFVEGKLTTIEEIENTREPAVSVDKLGYYSRPKPTPEGIKAFEEYRAESLVGKYMTCWYGGDTSEPYEVHVVCENEHEWVVLNPDGRFEVIDRERRGVTFFDSIEEGQRYKDKRTAEWEQEKAEYEAEITERIKEE